MARVRAGARFFALWLAARKFTTAKREVAGRTSVFSTARAEVIPLAEFSQTTFSSTPRPTPLLRCSQRKYKIQWGEVTP